MNPTAEEPRKTVGKTNRVSLCRALEKNDAFVFTHRGAVMQRILDAVNGGFTHYISGSSKVESFSEKLRSLHSRFELVVSKSTELRRRKADENVFRLFCYYNEKNREIEWFLVSRPSSDPEKSCLQSESWRCVQDEKENFHFVKLPKDVQWSFSARNERNPVEYKYRLFRETSPGRAGPFYSWGWCIEYNIMMQFRARTLIQKREFEKVFVLFEGLKREPMHSGVRRYIKGLISETFKAFKLEEKFPNEKTRLAAMKKIPYLRRISDEGRGKFWSRLNSEVLNSVQR